MRFNSKQGDTGIGKDQVRKKIAIILKEWLIYSLKWVAILAISLPMMTLIIGLLSQILPNYANAGKHFLSLNSVFTFMVRGAEMGFFAGFIFGGFSLMMSLGIKANKN